jgi:2-polyprenyl-6-hydroxyphenyl methylase / 3-demethylubiquinone-9 3-methyltransferase
MQTDYSKADSKLINNSVYHDLEDRWYTACDDPIALLRAETRLKNPWILEKIREHAATTGNEPKVLDVGCGAGFLSNYLSANGLDTTGIDLSESSLETARRQDEGGKARYVYADAYKLPFDDGSFDVVTSTDFLEHVSEPKRVLDEIQRCLKPGGLFVFHTFNKTKLAHLLVIKCMEWFVKNTPDHLHVIDLFISPDDLKKWLVERGFQIHEMRGVRPVIFQKAVFNLLKNGEIDHDFQFKWTNSLAVSYIGLATKSSH